MNNKIFFVKNPESIVIDNLRGDTIVVNHPTYTKLPIIKNARYMSLDEFKACYMTIHFVNLIVVGLNKIITPSNRCDMFNDFLQTMTRSKNKISIDTTPFVGEPWRAWYHFDVVGENKWGVPHGFAIETEWKKWFFRDVADCRFSANGIKSFKGDCVVSDLNPLAFEIKYNSVSEEEKKWYNEIKEIVICKFNTPKSMINSLLKECNEHFNLRYSMNSYMEGIKYTLPNLGVYRFVTEENERRKNIFNELIK